MSSSERSSTVRDSLGLGLAVGLYGAAFGAAADAAGLSVWQAVSMSALMFTGASQFALVGVLGAAGLGGTARAALDAVVPAAFLALLWPRLRATFPEAVTQRKVALGGAVIALALTPFVPAGVQVIAAVAAVAQAGPPRTGERPTAAEEMA